MPEMYMRPPQPGPVAMTPSALGAIPAFSIPIPRSLNPQPVNPMPIPNPSLSQVPPPRFPFQQSPPLTNSLPQGLNSQTQPSRPQLQQQQQLGDGGNKKMFDMLNGLFNELKSVRESSKVVQMQNEALI